MTLKWKGMLTWFQILWVSVRSQKNPFKHKILVVDMFFRCKSRRFSRAYLLILQNMWKLTIFIRISTETVIPHPRDLKLTFYPSSLLFLSVQTSCPSSGPRLTSLCLGQGPAGIWPSMLSSNSGLLQPLDSHVSSLSAWDWVGLTVPSSPGLWTPLYFITAHLFFSGHNVYFMASLIHVLIFLMLSWWKPSVWFGSWVTFHYDHVV